MRRLHSVSAVWTVPKCVLHQPRIKTEKRLEHFYHVLHSCAAFTLKRVIQNIPSFIVLRQNNKQKHQTKTFASCNFSQISHSTDKSVAGYLVRYVCLCRWWNWTASVSSAAFRDAGTLSNTRKVTCSIKPLRKACIVSTGVAPKMPRKGSASTTSWNALCTACCDHRVRIALLSLAAIIAIGVANK